MQLFNPFVTLHLSLTHQQQQRTGVLTANQE